MHYSHYMHAEYRKLVNSKPGERPRRFVDYCKRAIAAYDSGNVTIRDAAHAIAGATFIKEVSADHQLEDITFLAGHLELPPEVHRLDTAKAWKDLEEMVKAAELSLR